MRSFVRTLKYTWPYRWRLAASIVCALLVAALWGGSLALISPVLTILSTEKNLQQWVADEIEQCNRAINKLEQEELTPHQNKLQQVKDNPAAEDRENGIRRLGHDVAQIEAKISDLRRSVYRYQLLNVQVVRHLPRDRFETFLWIVCAVIVCVAIKGVFEFLHEWLVGGVMNRSLFDFRNRFFRRAIHQDVRQLTAAGGTTEMMARFTNDMEQVGLGMKILYGRMIAEPLKMIACLTCACLISWQLTLVFAVLVPLSLAALMKISKMMRRAARKVLERMSAIYKIVNETFTGVRAVKGFTREPHERRRFRRATEEYYRKAMRVVNIDAFANPMIELLGVTAVLLALTAGTYLVVTGNTHIFGMRMTTYPLTFIVLLQLYGFLAATADPIRKMSSVYTKLQVAEAASKRIYELFDRNPSVTANASGPRVGPVKEEIEFRNVCFSYDPGTETLSNIHLKVKAGETIAIVGGNGCGKTTLLGLLPRFYDPTHGAV
ncbi:MAG TPA: ABC transporter ATP-binding protein, partial [Gemmataceae bacterium]|nr:ABC transporter ATP-binding protein [Gemmataceae bacterium]